MNNDHDFEEERTLLLNYVVLLCKQFMVNAYQVLVL